MSRQKTPSGLRLKVITSRSLIVDAEVDEVSFPSLDGELGILPGHRPLVTAVGKGELAYKRAMGGESFSVESGYARVLPDEVVIVTELSQDETPRTDEG